MNFRGLVLSGVVGAMLVARSASAQEATQPTSPTPGPAPTAPAVDPTPSSPTDAALLAPPPDQQTQLVLPKPPCGLLRHPCSYPHLTVAVDGGISSFNESGPFGFDTGIGGVTNLGGSWGARVGIELTRWLAVDAHYIGIFNDGTGVAGSIGFFTTAATGELRFTLPFPKVFQPYLIAGAGVYSTTISGTDKNIARSGFHSSTELGVPLGIGVQVPVHPAVNAGLELVYHRFFGEGFYVDDDNPIGGGDLLTLNLVIRAKL